jgi:tetratricopeptide (TPR) repeat protein
MDEPLRKQRAIELWEAAQQSQQDGDFDRAIALYTESIDAYPTAEAFTYRGWAKSFKGLVDEAIEDCHRAIAVDPSFGNPYNDIGCYLLQKGEPDQAIPWLEKAKGSERYEPRHFPFMNLGRIYAAKGFLGQAIREFEGALKLCPEDPFCVAAVAKLRAKLN